ncbi:MAG: alanine racemase [Synergistaceae bacterium]
MTNPHLIINLDALTHNASVIKKSCCSLGIRADSVVKCVCGDIQIANAILEGGIDTLLDSRMKNIISLKRDGLKCPIGLLRVPMLSELSLMISYADWCLVSMPEAVMELEKICATEKKEFKVLLMIDIGDLREGLWPDRIDEIAGVFHKCRRVRCIGAGTNLGCFGGVMPSEDNLSRLVHIALELKNDLLMEEWLISAGGTNIYFPLMNSEITPGGINHLRIGGALLRGKCGTHDIKGLRRDTVLLSAEYVEIAKKPSKPIGTIGIDAFGNVPNFEDKGMRFRAIAALGKQDVIPEDIDPLSEGINVLGASSDHLVLDIEDASPRPKLGDSLKFSFKRYGGMLQAFNSDYVERVYVKDK